MTRTQWILIILGGVCLATIVMSLLNTYPSDRDEAAFRMTVAQDFTYLACASLIALGLTECGRKP